MDNEKGMLISCVVGEAWRLKRSQFKHTRLKQTFFHCRFTYVLIYKRTYILFAIRLSLKKVIKVIIVSSDLLGIIRLFLSHLFFVTLNVFLTRASMLSVLETCFRFERTQALRVDGIGYHGQVQIPCAFVIGQESSQSEFNAHGI